MSKISVIGAGSVGAAVANDLMVLGVVETVALFALVFAIMVM